MLNVGRSDSIFVEVLDYDRTELIVLDNGFEHNYDYWKNYFEKNIITQLSEDYRITLIITHPHNDHIGASFRFLTDYGSRVKECYFNNLSQYFSTDEMNVIYEYQAVENYSQIKIDKLIESIDNSKRIADELRIKCIPTYPIFSDSEFNKSTNFRVLSPSFGFFTSLINQIKSKLRDKTYTEIVPSKPIHDINPCVIIDQVRESNIVNMTSTIISFTDSNNYQYIFTSDASTHTLEDAIENGHSFDNCKIFQLPHHGSRRNINSNLLKFINPSEIWVSTDGKKRQTWIDSAACIKKIWPDIDLKITCHEGDLLFDTSIIKI